LSADEDFQDSYERALAQQYADEVLRLEQEIVRLQAEVRRLEQEVDRLEDQLRRAVLAAAEGKEVK